MKTQEQFNNQVDNIRNSTEATWDGVKATSQKAFYSLKDGFQQSRQRLNEKIEADVSKQIKSPKKRKRYNEKHICK